MTPLEAMYHVNTVIAQHSKYVPVLLLGKPGCSSFVAAAMLCLHIE